MYYKLNSRTKQPYRVTSKEYVNSPMYKEGYDKDKKNYVSLIFIGIAIDHPPYFEVAIRKNGKLNIIEVEYETYEEAKKVFEFHKLSMKNPGIKYESKSMVLSNKKPKDLKRKEILKDLKEIAEKLKSEIKFSHSMELKKSK
ncbi:MAG: hypothetical protein KDK36_03035 [Leptospiraceae bacterium]|nr:hypothetical protein [Leptospiraceae bacterium]